ncbi:MAG: ASCH domain-containing protein [Acidimicrobiia bacterium]|nr:ASCH domain-containing protein [Acidimicrobiia bacterium]
MKNLWLSIHPRWVAAILDGRKVVELRRRAPSVDRGASAVLYSTSPESKVVGSAVVQAVVELPLDELWHQYGERADISHAEFATYFEGRETGAAIEFAWVDRLQHPMDLQSIRDLGFEPAQGWRYLSEEATAAVLGHSAVCVDRSHGETPGSDVVASPC